MGREQQGKAPTTRDPGGPAAKFAYYQAQGGTSSWDDWIASGYPADPETQANNDAYQQYRAAGGTWGTGEWNARGRPTQQTRQGREYSQHIDAYQAYKKAGGTLGFNDWMSRGRPTGKVANEPGDTGSPDGDGGGGDSSAFWQGQGGDGTPSGTSWSDDTWQNPYSGLAGGGGDDRYAFNPGLAQGYQGSQASFKVGDTTVAAPDYEGSSQEWEEYVYLALLDRWYQDPSFTGFSLPTDGLGIIGAKPQPGDPVSQHAQQFIRNYIRRHGSNDPWIAQHFGKRPDRSATYQTQETEFLYKARIDDLTRRYIAEGEWGVTRYVEELREQGMMDRLALELGFKREELVQRAIEERNRRDEALRAMSLDAAQFGMNPRNMFAYAAWLAGNNLPVTPQAIAMAQQEVPVDQLHPQITEQFAGPLAALDQVHAAEQSGGDLGAPPPEYGGIVDTQQPAAGGQKTTPAAGSTPPSGSMASTSMTPDTPRGQEGAAKPTADQLSQEPGTATVKPLEPGPLGQPQHIDPTVSAQPTLNITQLLQQYGTTAPSQLDPYGLHPEAPTVQQLQSITDSLRTSDTPQPTRTLPMGDVNALGVKIPEAHGSQVDYRQFSKLLPSQKDQKLSGVSSVGRDERDYFTEIDRSRPRGGGATIRAGFG